MSCSTIATFPQLRAFWHCTLENSLNIEHWSFSSEHARQARSSFGHHLLELAKFLHHLLHLTKLVQESIYFRDSHTAAFGNADTAFGVQNLRAAPLLRRHCADDAFHPAKLLLLF